MAASFISFLDKPKMPEDSHCRPVSLKSVKNRKSFLSLSVSIRVYPRFQPLFLFELTMSFSLPLDLRSALRGLARDRAFTLFSILALALSLGLNGSLLVLSRAFLLRPAPVAQPAALLEVADVWKQNVSADYRGSTTAYEAVRVLPEFEGTALCAGRSPGAGTGPMAATRCRSWR